MPHRPGDPITDVFDPEPGERPTAGESAMEQLVSRMIDEAEQWREENIEPDQDRATEYYKGDITEDVDDIAGRSTVTMTDVRDTVLMLLPDILEIFHGPERVVEFRPVGPEDEALAEQQTEYVDQVVIRQDNDAFSTLHALFKDALIRKLGIAKWWWDESPEIVETHHTGLTELQVGILQAEEDATEFRVEQTSDATVDDDGNTLVPALFDVTVRREVDRGRARFEAVPNEEFIVSPNARSLDDARLVGHIKDEPADRLIALGVDPQLVERGKGATSDVHEGLEAARRPDSGGHTTDEDEQPSETRPVRVAECYVRMPVSRGRPSSLDPDEEFDLDEALSEDDPARDMEDVTEPAPVALHRVFCVHAASTRAGTEGSKWVFAFEPEIVDEVPFALFGPDPEPHTVYGQSIADRVMDLQRINSQIWRGILDSLAQHLQPSTAVDPDRVNLADVLNPEVGRIVRVRGALGDSYRELTTEFVGASALPVLQFTDDVRATRTGATKASAGLDPDVLQSTTQVGVEMTRQASQRQIRMIARIFAETGMKRLFKGLLKLVVENQDIERTVRLRNQWVTFDPRSWHANMDVQVNVGLGSGSTDEKLRLLGLIAAKQEEHLQAGSPLVGFPELRHTYAAMTELAGFRDATRFWKPFGPQEQQQLEQAPKPPSAEELLARVEMEKIQQRDRESRLESVTDLQKARIQAEVDLIEAQIRAGERFSEAQMKARLQAAQNAVKAAEVALKREQAEVDTVERATAQTPEATVG